MRRRNVGGVAGLDVVVELVDLVVERVDGVEERLGDGVRERRDDHAGRPLVGRSSVERLAALRRLAHGHDALARRDEVDLLEDDASCSADHVGVTRTPKTYVLRPSSPRPRLVVVDERREQTVDHVVVSVRGEGLLERRAVGIEQVDPIGHASRVAAGRS